jgi:hypothetical protein
LTVGLYFPNELVLMLGLAGFVDVVVETTPAARRRATTSSSSSSRGSPERAQIVLNCSNGCRQALQ